jgi:hypothetical protein
LIQQIVVPSAEYLPQNPFPFSLKIAATQTGATKRILKIHLPLFGQNRITFDI